jgi:hypothetical protein
VDNLDDFRGMTVLTKVDRAETRVEDRGVVTRTVTQTRRMRTWAIIGLYGLGGETVRLILGVVVEFAHQLH